MKKLNNIIMVSCLIFLFIVSLSGTAQAKFKHDKQTPVQSAYQRIVSLKPNITQILIGLGLGDRIVGVTQYCPKPNNTVEVVADYNSIQPESIIRLKPDLVLSSLENSQSQQYDVLSRSNLNLKFLSFGDYTEMQNSLHEMAALFDKTDLVNAELAKLTERFERFKLRFKSETGIKKLFLIVVQRQPLVIATRHTFASSVFEMAGLQNAFAANQIEYPVVDEEELIRELTDFSFELTHEPKTNGPVEFLNKSLIQIPIENVLSSVEGANYLLDVLENNGTQVTVAP